MEAKSESFAKMAGIIPTTEKLQERINALEELLEINLYLNASLDLDSVLKLILQSCRQALKTQAVSILLLDKNTNELYFRSAIGGNADTITPYRLKPGEGIAGAVIQTKEPILVEDAQSDPRFARRFDSTSGFVTRSLMAIPMWSKKQLTGVLEMINKKSPQDGVESFSEYDLQKGVILANMAAVAIENARLYEEITRAEKSKADFISVISHELRTPLVPIKGFAHLLLNQKAKLPEETQNEFLEEIIRQGDHLNMLIEDLFLVNKVEGAQFIVQANSTSFLKLVHEALAIKKINQQLHPVKVSMEPPLGKEREPMLNVDAEKFTHLLVHLLDNAVKFSPEGGEITVKLSNSHGEVQVSVEDRGVGVPDQHREEIFNCFFQLDSSSTRRFGGTGTGLFIVKKIVEAHGGSVDCQPVSPKGTRIITHLPPGTLILKK